MATIIGVNIYIDGTKRNENPLSLTGTFNVSAWFNPGDNLSVEAKLVYDDNTESPKSDVQAITLAEQMYLSWKTDESAENIPNGGIQVTDAGNSNTDWDNGGYATKEINGNNEIFFKVRDNSVLALGLLSVFKDISTELINTPDVLMLVNTANGAMNVNENGQQIYNSNDWELDDLLSIQFVSGQINFRRNGVTFYSVNGYSLPLTPVTVLKGGNQSAISTSYFGNSNLNLSTLILTTKFPVFEYSNTSLDTLYWPQVYLSSEWPEFTTSKPYFILYSTDHNSDLGGIVWGEFDGFENGFMKNFVERGVVFTGYQIETPFLMRIPNAVSGISEEIFLYCHTNTAEAGNNGIQQTRLYTTSGGDAIHECTWTDRGRPLGLESGENHTGYLTVFQREDGKYIGNHQYDGFNPEFGKISISDDGLNWTRLQQFDGTENMPAGSYFNHSQINPFTYNSQLYAFVNQKDADPGIALVKLDTDTYLPSEYVSKLFDETIRDLRVFIENGKAYCMYKKGTSAANNYPYHNFVYDLEEIDTII
ncbi:hypothetical protein INR75_02775 [Zunongwangia sp. SCSIO 43204]|uniref:hypothetical protein n=1 Tax=Zunongwangia sp. SCSIO 43204 TaxID=2779359 RepID=UPI001CA8D4EA|nr:hypothetical protein [Zunongwangia sp. SCSIO 43204]UAB84971.1 hypothetical protein INR75_02775 [Zunongwangia sp. SCSIO 43204]